MNALRTSVLTLGVCLIVISLVAWFVMRRWK